MQEGFYESGSCAKIICAILGVHPKIWEHFGNNRCQKRAKTGFQDARESKTNQQHSVLRFDSQSGNPGSIPGTATNSFGQQFSTVFRRVAWVWGFCLPGLRGSVLSSVCRMGM